MYLFLISIAVGLAVGFGISAWLGGWVLASFLGFIAFAVCWIVTARRIQKRIQPVMIQAAKQAQAGLFQPALQTWSQLLPYKNWMPMLSGQVYAQMGALAYQAGNQEQAVEHLSKASRRVPEAPMILASLHYLAGRTDAASSVLGTAVLHNRKHTLLHNVYAFILAKEGKTGEAMAQLNKLLAKNPDHAITKDNLLRLQNGRKMNMKGFGMEWYALKLERPPASMGQVQQARKGFRQPPKRR